MALYLVWYSDHFIWKRRRRHTGRGITMDNSMKKTVIKFQKALIGNTVLMISKDRNIIIEEPMDSTYEGLFKGRYKMYRICKYRKSDGFLEIGKEVMADW